MTEANPSNLEQATPEAYTSFVRLLKAIAAVPKTAIYELDPRMKPKSKSLEQAQNGHSST
jgi:hypothetical protein